ncbi:MAG: thiol-disulfide oxidoreductase DCC family protein [Thermoanaerobaculia bacterium]
MKLWAEKYHHSSCSPGAPAPQPADAVLTVLYDDRCALCRRARAWLADQPKYVSMAFLPAGSNEARRRFPDLDHGSSLEELTVVGWGGEVYRGAKAWVMCLWALKKYRSASLRLSEPEMIPVARRLIAWVSRNRFWIGEAAGWTK